MGQRRLGFAMLLAGIATFALLYATQPLLPALTRAFHISEAEASLAVSLTTGPLGIALLVAGLLSDQAGRRRMMIASLLAASTLTLVSALVQDWTVLLVSRFLVGIALAGVPSVAMAYVAEEGDPSSISTVMGLYVSGTTVGGMAGRLGAAWGADLIGWHGALAVMGGLCLLIAIVFCWAAPPSRHFTPRRHNWSSLRDGAKRLFRDPVLPWLFGQAFILMGGFVSLYNYAGFHLVQPPFRLSQAAVGAIFLLYMVGTLSSAWFGRIAARHGMAQVFRAAIALFLVGVALTALPSLPGFIAGLAIATGGFFGAHAIASSWVSHRAGIDRAQAASFYLFFYYMGSSILGSVGGIAWGIAGWGGVTGFTAALVVIGLVVAMRLRRTDIALAAQDGTVAQGA